MVLVYSIAPPVQTQDNTAIFNMNPTVTIGNSGLTMNIQVAWDDNGPGANFPSPGAEPVHYGGSATQVSYLPTSTAWQILVELPYAAQPSAVGTSKIDVLELWTPDG